ncbi:hypothetical protein TWF730_002585 [Orbilia blumenaviensis]|uniref:Uncharacterized protein n=1 Tax=Orbilia blumenaviensis TaxID=1796055 RepID=A0AAV9UBX5_9PEZI
MYKQITGDIDSTPPNGYPGDRPSTYFQVSAGRDVVLGTPLGSIPELVEDIGEDVVLEGFFVAERRVDSLGLAEPGATNPIALGGEAGSKDCGVELEGGVIILEAPPEEGIERETPAWTQSPLAAWIVRSYSEVERLALRHRTIPDIHVYIKSLVPAPDRLYEIVSTYKLVYRISINLYSLSI